MTKVFEEAINAVKFLGWLKKFGSAQNILGLVKGQGNRVTTYLKPIFFKMQSSSSSFLLTYDNNTGPNWTGILSRLVTYI